VVEGFLFIPISNARDGVKDRCLLESAKQTPSSSNRSEEGIVVGEGKPLNRSFQAEVPSLGRLPARGSVTVGV
jgi:hypothetical protein